MEYHSRLIYALKDINAKDEINFKIANQILKFIDKKNIPSLKELSSSSYVSNATINRFCKRIKIIGFKELKTLIKLEIVFRENNIENLVEDKLPLFYEKLLVSNNKTWESNFVTISQMMKIDKNPLKRVHILTTTNYLNYANILKSLVQNHNYYVSIFNGENEWLKSNEISSDYIIAITYSSDRKSIINIFDKRKNINKKAAYILMSYVNPFYQKDNDIYFFKIFGENKKNEIPSRITSKSISAIFDMLDYFFSKK